MNPPTHPTRIQEKPVVLDAMQITLENAESVARWAGGRYYYVPGDGGESSEGSPSYVSVQLSTPEGDMAAYEGWWVIRNNEGVFYPISNYAFEVFYEKVEGQDAGG